MLGTWNEVAGTQEHREVLISSLWPLQSGEVSTAFARHEDNSHCTVNRDNSADAADWLSFEQTPLKMLSHHAMFCGTPEMSH